MIGYIVFAVNLNAGPMVIMAHLAHLPQEGLIGESMVDPESVPGPG
jgi:hypothetical protein